MTTRRRVLGLAARVLGVVALAGAPAAPAVGGSPRAATEVAEVGSPRTTNAPVADRPAVGAGSLSVRISGFAPAIPRAGGTLTVRGTVTNVSAQPVSGISVALRVSPTPLVNRDEIAEVLAGSGSRVGIPVTGSSDEVADELAPGGSATFVLRTAVDDLDLSTTGVYVTGVEAVGATSDVPVRQDLDRTFLPWWPPDAPVEPLLVTMLWPLTGAPLRDASGVLLSETPAVEMSPEGRLSTLLESGAANPGAMTLVVDPEVVDAAAGMADGYEVVGPGDTTVPGTRSREVASWLQALERAVAAPRAQAGTTLYAWPDVEAARRGRVLSTMLRQRESIDDQTARELGRRLPGNVVLVPGGNAAAPTLAALATADVGPLVLSDLAAPLDTSVYFTPSGNVRLPTADGVAAALLVDSGLAAALAMPLATEAQVITARQTMLAETLVTATELPETQRLLVGAPDPTWSPSPTGARMVSDVMAGAPWIVPTPVAAALAREPSTLPRTLAGYGPEQQAQQLPAVQVDAARAQYRGLADYATVTSDPAAFPQVARTAPTRLMGAYYRDHPKQAARMTERVDGQVRATAESVRVVSSGSITVSGASGTIPITVENSGPLPVTVGLELASTPPQLVTADPVEPFEIAPARRSSVEVVAQVAAAGPIPVTIQLVTAQGRPFGQPGELVVESSAYANAARILIRGSLAVLIIAVAVHAVRRYRRGGRAGRSPGGRSPGAGDAGAAEGSRAATSVAAMGGAGDPEDPRA